MERFAVFLVALLAAVFLIKLIPRLPFASETETEACGRPTMSPAELRFYQVLLQCIPAGHEVWAKARVCDFGAFRDGYVDFLITRGGERSPVLVVDLDELGPAGLRSEAVSPDLIPSLPVLKVSIASDYVPSNLRTRITESLGISVRKAA